MSGHDIKALMMRIKLAKVKGKHQVLGSKVYKIGKFKSELHPRGPGGQFASKPGSNTKKQAVPKKPIPSREARLRQKAADAAPSSSGDRAANKKYKELREKLGLSQGGKNVALGKVHEARLARAQALRAQRAARTATPAAKPARPDSVERAKRLLGKIDARSHTMEPATVASRIGRMGNALNAKQVAELEKHKLGVSLGKSKADKIAAIATSVANRRKSRDRVKTIQANAAR